MRQWWVLAALILSTWCLSQGWSWWQERDTIRALQRSVQPGDIVIYTTADCPFCARAKRWLTTHAIPWQECPIESQQRCQHDYAVQGSPGVPLLRVRQTWHLGFDPEWVRLLVETTPANSRQASPSLSSEPRP